MKERPILFSGEMVRAILDGRKTQTRRVVKPQPVFADRFCGVSSSGYCFTRGDDCIPLVPVRCKWGVGDRLWVRETWAEAIECCHHNHLHGSRKYLYKASDSCANKWRPSIFMPRWASRITLEITNVRVERVQDISERDVIAEGFETGSEYWYSNFAATWNSINAKRGYGWDTNPWVWVIEFERVTP